MKKWIAIISMTAAALSASAGYLGENSLQVGAAYLDVSGGGFDVDGWGAGTNVNFNLQKTESSGTDIKLSLLYGRTSGHGVTYKDKIISLSGVYFFETGKVKPFVSLDVDYFWSKMESSTHRGKFDGFRYGASAGVEFSPADSFTTTVKGSFRHNAESHYDTWVIGIDGIYWIQTNSGIGLELTYSKNGSVSTLQLAALYTLKF